MEMMNVTLQMILFKESLQWLFEKHKFCRSSRRSTKIAEGIPHYFKAPFSNNQAAGKFWGESNFIGIQWGCYRNGMGFRLRGNNARFNLKLPVS